MKELFFLTEDQKRYFGQKLFETIFNSLEEIPNVKGTKWEDVRPWVQQLWIDRAVVFGEFAVRFMFDTARKE
jgi:hypothetical protein